MAANKNIRNYSEGEIVGNGIMFIRESERHISPCGHSKRTAFFKCYCGNEFRAIILDVVTSKTKSCGCLVTAKNSTHRGSNHYLYNRWKSIKRRCYNKNNSSYKYYGGRGITVSEEFKNDFNAFMLYVESLPEYENVKYLNLSIDRIDNNKGYERGNLRWATKSQQMSNRSINRLVTINSETKTVSEWCKKYGINDTSCVYLRIKNGWTIEDAITTQLPGTRKHSLTFNGTTKTITEWSNDLGISRSTLFSRIRNGWSVNKSITVPIKTKKHKAWIIINSF